MFVNGLIAIIALVFVLWMRFKTKGDEIS